MPTVEQLTASYPPAPPLRPVSVRSAMDEHASTRPVFIVLDDDPTGTQSVSDLPVLTAWEEADLQWALAQDPPAVYVMTNSRSLGPDRARAVTVEVCRAAEGVAARTGQRLAFVSRSDSTLRGHFPLEPWTIMEEMEVAGRRVDGIILVPAFPEAGRITVTGCHYTRVGQDYLPSADTEFARDSTFGYRSSRLAQWVEEKTDGVVRAADVLTPDLETVRTRPELLRDQLMALRRGQVLAPDVVCEEDLLAVASALVDVEAQGRSFVYRVGPPFMRARLGQDPRPPLSAAQVERACRAAGEPDRPRGTGGLVVVGSHVGLTTRQVEVLLERTGVPVFELDVPRLLEDDSDVDLRALAARATDLLADTTVVLRTSRTLVTGGDQAQSLAVSRCVSTAVVEVVREVLERISPRFVVAKGGITSSDVASRGLGIRHAHCVGPMLPGIVSLWTAQDGPARGIPYVVFPGNVGDDASLAEVVQRLEE